MKILLLSAYESISHRVWRDGLVETFPEYDWHVLTMAPRYFSWRIRGNALHFSECLSEIDLNRIDLVIATSMVDFSTVLALEPALANVRSVVYFHENQFAYPLSGNQFRSLEPAMVNFYSALSANDVVFNSQYNQDSFTSGLTKALARFPDYVPEGLVERISSKSQVLPVALPSDLRLSSENREYRRRGLVWNHRWEYDKAPERLLCFLKKLPRELDMPVHIIGQHFKQQPACMREIKILLEDSGRLGHWGFVETRDEYLTILMRSKFSLSTAIHDFQGLSVLESAALGCIPLVPDRLAYREFVPDTHRYASIMSDPDKETESAIKLLLRLSEVDLGKVSVDKLSWSELRSPWKALIEQ